MNHLDLRENTDGALNAVEAKINEIVDWINNHNLAQRTTQAQVFKEKSSPPRDPGKPRRN